MHSKGVNALFILGMVVAWSVYYAVSKYAVGATGSPYMAGLLLRAAALLFLTAQLAAEKKLRDVFRQGRTALTLMLIGVFGYLLDVFANIGYQHSTLSTGTALLKTDVLMVNLATVVIYRKKLYASDWLGTLIMLAGVLLVLEIDWQGMRLNWYDLFFIASAASVSVNAFIIKAAQEKLKADTDMIGYYNNFVVLLLFLVSALICGDLQSFSAPAEGSFWPLALLGGLAQSCIYFFYYRNLKRNEVWTVKLYLLLMPVLSCLIGVALMGDTLSTAKIIGIAVVLSGAALILLRNRLHPQAE